jgi:hypothetical protein
MPIEARDTMSLRVRESSRAPNSQRTRSLDEVLSLSQLSTANEVDIGGALRQGPASQFSLKVYRVTVYYEPGDIRREHKESLGQPVPAVKAWFYPVGDERFMLPTLSPIPGRAEDRPVPMREVAAMIEFENGVILKRKVRAGDSLHKRDVQEILENKDRTNWSGAVQDPKVVPLGRWEVKKDPKGILKFHQPNEHASLEVLGGRVP